MDSEFRDVEFRGGGLRLKIERFGRLGCRNQAVACFTAQGLEFGVG